MSRSLNGGETKPLTAHSFGILKKAAEAPVACSSINPGVRDRLTRKPEPLCRIIKHPSPFKKHKGEGVDHIVPTEAGLRLLKET